MRISAHILCYNEEDLIAHTLSHYKKFCHAITVYDNYSVDESPHIARDLGAHVVQYGTPGSLDDRDYLKIKNNCWKGSFDDFVIVCDMDEILYDPKLLEKLNYYRTVGMTIPSTIGWNVYSEKALTDDSDLIRDFNEGFIDPAFSKRIIFNPKAIKEINYQYGAHKCNPIGKVIPSTSALQVRHYRCLGGVQRMIDRHKMYAPRMSQFNLKHRLSFHYLRTEEEIRKEWAQNIAKVQPIK